MAQEAGSNVFLNKELKGCIDNLELHNQIDSLKIQISGVFLFFVFNRPYTQKIPLEQKSHIWNPSKRISETRNVFLRLRASCQSFWVVLKHPGLQAHHVT